MEVKTTKTRVMVCSKEKTDEMEAFNYPGLKTTSNRSRKEQVKETTAKTKRMTAELITIM